MPKPTHRKPARQSVVANDLHQFQLVSDPQISPDGRRILFTHKRVGQKNDYVTSLWLVDADGTGAPVQFTAGPGDSHGRWSPDGTRIAFISRRDKFRPQIYSMRAEGGEACALTSFADGSIRDFRWSPDGRSLAVAYRATSPEWTDTARKEREERGLSTPPRVSNDIYYRFDGDGYFLHQRYALYCVDGESGTASLVFDKDVLGNFSYDWSPDSRHLAIAANLDKDALIKPWQDELFRLDVGTGRLTTVPHLPPGTKTGVRWSPDGKCLAYVGREGKQDVWGVENQHLFVCDARRGAPRNLTGGEDYCLAAVTLSDTREAAFDPQIVWGRDSRRIYTNIGWQGETHVASVPVGGGVLTFHTSGPANFDLGNFSADGSQAALVRATQLELAEVACAVCDRRTGAGPFNVNPLTRLNADYLGARHLSAAESHWIKSTDGTEVQVWVMKPPKFKSGKKYPALLEVHGGPHAQYGLTFFHEFQTLASAGYVVVFSNPRGSKGYGEAHCTAIKGKWGQADWQDVQAVTAFMQSQPFIDRKRMGIMGGSYGGYMTNWAIGHTDEFAAAITDRSVVNLMSMAGSSDIPLVPDHYWPGNAWDQPEELWSQSPLKYFGNVRTPTLVIHSEGDLRCNIEQGEQVFATLKLRGIASRLVRYPASTSHGMSRSGPPDLRIHRLNEILEWWQKYL